MLECEYDDHDYVVSTYEKQTIECWDACANSQEPQAVVHILTLNKN